MSPRLSRPLATSPCGLSVFELPSGPLFPPLFRETPRFCCGLGFVTIQFRDRPRPFPGPTDPFEPDFFFFPPNSSQFFLPALPFPANLGCFLYTPTRPFLDRIFFTDKSYFFGLPAHGDDIYSTPHEADAGCITGFSLRIFVSGSGTIYLVFACRDLFSKKSLFFFRGVSTSASFTPPPISFFFRLETSVFSGLFFFF